MSKTTTVHNLVCYLFKEGLTEYSELFKKIDKKSCENLFSKVPLQKNLNLDLVGYILQDKDSTPSWKSKLSPIFDFPDEINNKSNSFVFFVKVDARFLAYTMGYSHHYLNKSKIEYDFGLKTTLNEISHSDIKGIDTKKIALSPNQKREVSTDNNSFWDFEFNYHTEFINTLMGKASNHKFANTLIGKESLKINVDLDINDIVEYSKRLITSYNKKDYLANFDFIDKLKVIKDPDIWKTFKLKILNEFKNKNKKSMLFSYPSVSDVDFSYYKIQYSHFSKLYSDISIDIFFNFCDEKEISFEDIDLDKVHIYLKKDDDETSEFYSIWDYLVYEFNQSSKKYIYTSNQIFEIEDNYYKEIISDIDKYELPLKDKDIVIPNIYYTKIVDNNKTKTKIEHEEDYNKRFTALNKNNCICLDKKNFRDFPDRKNDQVEICDIVTKDKELICVKTYKNSSSVLSHLFSQGTVSAELFINVKNYRLKLKRFVQLKFKNFVDINKPNRKEFTIVYAICMQKDGKISENLPFFSKISLRHAINTLKTFDLNIKLIRIPFEENNKFKINKKKIKFS